MPEHLVVRGRRSANQGVTYEHSDDDMLQGGGIEP